MNVLKRTSSNYVQNVIENMVLTSYLDEPYFVASLGGYVSSIQKMSRNKLKHQVRGQFMSCDKFILSHDMSHRWLRYTMTAKQVNAAIDVFLVYYLWTVATCCMVLCCIRLVYYKTLIPWKHNKYVLSHFEHKNDVTVIMKLHRSTRLWLVAPYKSLTMIVTSFLSSKCNRT